jgi:hypothetical protein
MRVGIMGIMRLRRTPSQVCTMSSGSHLGAAEE